MRRFSLFLTIGSVLLSPAFYFLDSIKRLQMAPGLTIGFMGGILSIVILSCSVFLAIRYSSKESM